MLYGRSSSVGLNGQWRRVLPLLIGGGLYHAYDFVQSRKNRADGPTRDGPPQPPVHRPPAWWYAPGGDRWKAWAVAAPVARTLAQWAVLTLLLLDGPRSAVATTGPSAAAVAGGYGALMSALLMAVLLLDWMFVGVVLAVVLIVVGLVPLLRLGSPRTADRRFGGCCGPLPLREPAPPVWWRPTCRRARAARLRLGRPAASRVRRLWGGVP